MDTILLLIRVALAAVFVLAGVGKLLDLPGSRKAMRDFGVPEPYSGYAGTALPIAELLIAVLLIPSATAWWAALAALLLLLAFIGGMANVMRQGKAPDCHCFGQLHPEPVGWQGLARNGVLALMALVVVVQGPSDPGPGPIGWWADMSDATQVALALGGIGIALFAVQGWFLFQLMQQNGRLLLRLDALESQSAGETPATRPMAPNAGLPVGITAPSIRLPDLNGRLHTLETLRMPGKPVLLVFTDANCGPCTALMPEIGAGNVTMPTMSQSRLSLGETSNPSVRRRRPMAFPGCCFRTIARWRPRTTRHPRRAQCSSGPMARSAVRQRWEPTRSGIWSPRQPHRQPTAPATIARWSRCASVCASRP